jgi:hypothetical protein
MKIGVILPGRVDIEPYVRYYTDVFDTLEDLEYEIICWNRDGLNPNMYNNHKVISIGTNSTVYNYNIYKILDYYYFSKMVRKIIFDNKYDKLIIHTIVLAVYLKNILLNEYKDKYILDIRDYSPIYPFVKRLQSKIISSSYKTVISSPGFLCWLPPSNKYLLSHNVAKSKLVDLLSSFKLTDYLDSEFVVLTLGKIRDYKSNLRLISNLGDVDRFCIYIVGTGETIDKLKAVSGKRYTNVFFDGYYEKNNEDSIVEKSHFINILLDTNKLSDTLMANRFYLALLHRKVMIVNEKSFHANYVREYGIGILVKNDDDLVVKISDFMSNFDQAKFNQKCMELIMNIQRDICFFENKLVGFVRMKN